MSSVLDSVDQRTKLVGENRLELLLFKLGGRQTFAINVFKVQEVLNLPNLTVMPHRHSCICGVTHFRGQTVPVINLSQAIGMRALEVNKESIIVVTEYNRSVQAFLVAGIEQIVNMTWENIMASSLFDCHYTLPRANCRNYRCREGAVGNIALYN